MIAPTLIVVLALSAIALFGIIRSMFHAPSRGSLRLFYAVTVLYVCPLSSLGLVTAVAVRNVAQAMMLILILFPMLLLSGARNPPETWSLGCTR